MVVSLIYTFVGGHAIGQGTVIWVFYKVCDYFMSLGSGMNCAEF